MVVCVCFGSWLDRRHSNGAHLQVGVNMDKVRGEGGKVAAVHGSYIRNRLRYVDAQGKGVGAGQSGMYNMTMMSWCIPTDSETQLEMDLFVS